MPTVESTLEFIKQAHAGQWDKSGKEYYKHPLAVMNRLPESASDETRMAALLHDVVEDTLYEREDLEAMGYSKATLDMVELVTKKPGDKRPYIAVIKDIIDSSNLGAIQIKYADMTENTDPKRLVKLPQEKQEYLTRKYARPYKMLEEALRRFEPQRGMAR